MQDSMSDLEALPTVRLIWVAADLIEYLNSALSLFVYVSQVSAK